MGFFALAVLLGLIPAAIAKSKGYSFGLWWLYGALLFIVALPHALIMKPNTEAVERMRMSDEGRRKCPFCAELVKVEATICRYCQKDLPPALSCPECGESVSAKAACPNCAAPVRRTHSFAVAVIGVAVGFGALVGFTILLLR